MCDCMQCHNPLQYTTQVAAFVLLIACKHPALQVVRRRRGDVHGDLNVVVLQLGAAAAAVTAQQQAQAPGSLPPLGAGRAAAGKALAAEAARWRAAARWALLRMHFMGYRRAARAHTLAQWDEVCQIDPAW